MDVSRTTEAPGAELSGPELPGAEPAGAELSAAGVADPAAVTVSALSPSRASDFMTCPLLFRFRVVDKLPQRPSSAATRGTVVHAVLERLYDLPAGERTYDSAAALVGPAWERLVEADPGLLELFAEEAEETASETAQTAHVTQEPLDGAPPAETALAARQHAWLEGARDLLRTYFTLEDPRRLEPADREVYVETTLDSGLRLRGYVDRLDVAPNGDVRVVDYKTGRAPSEFFEAKAMFQMRFYALVLWRQLGRIPRLLQLMYLGNGEILRYQPDEHDLRATERKIAALWQAIERAVRDGDWRPRPSKLCDWCDHHALCPAYGGTPPPLPETISLAEAADPLADAPSPRRAANDV